MKSFSEWPLEGLLVFSCVLAILAMLIFAPLFRSKKPIVRSTDGFLHLRPSRMCKIWSLAMVGFCLILSFVVSHSGFCLSMTESENAQNKMIGLILTAVFWIGTLFFIWTLFFVRYAFDTTKFVVRTPVSKKTYF